MALISMTGYGEGHAESRDLDIDVHLSSVNRRQFDARISLPRPLLALESRLVKLIRSRVRRGQVTGTVRIRVTDLARRKGVVVDTALARAYLRALRTTAREIGIDDDVALSSLLQLPEVIRYEAEERDGRRAWAPVAKAARMALEQLVDTRTREGAVLAKDIVRRVARLEKRLDQIRGLAPSVSQRYSRALRERLRNAGVDMGEAEPAFLRELSLFIDRADISEEIVRLESHFRQIAEVLEGTDLVGRALDFLCQEMLREINTVGSKANDGRIAAHVVHFKNELERVREQAQNVE